MAWRCGPCGRDTTPAASPRASASAKAKGTDSFERGGASKGGLASSAGTASKAARKKRASSAVPSIGTSRTGTRASS